MADSAERDALDTYCFRWVAPAIWPHGAVDVFAIQTTDDRSKVTCHACLDALGTQKYEPRVTPPAEGHAS